MNVHVGFPTKENEYKDVYAIESLCLGNKSYIDMLEYVNDEGNKIHDQHVRMKGVPTSCIDYYAKTTNTCQYYMFITMCMIINLLQLI